MLDESGDRRPFFLFAHFSDPHTPYNAHHLRDTDANEALDDVRIATLSTSNMTSWEHSMTLEPGEHRISVHSEERFKIRRFRLRLGGHDLEYRLGQGQSLRKVDRVDVAFEVPGEESVEVELVLWIHDIPADGADRKAHYALEVEFVDRAIGELLDELEARGLYDDALIVLTSDHREELGGHGHFGHIRHLFDAAIHVPLIIKPPRSHRDSKRLQRASARVASHIDVVPTVLEMLGLPPLPSQMGMPLWEGDERVHLAETRKPVAPKDVIALRDSRYKMIYVVDDDRFEMYDVVEDPAEQYDIFETHAERRSAWTEILPGVGASADGALDLTLSGEVEEQLRALGYLDGDAE